MSNKVNVKVFSLSDALQLTKSSQLFWVVSFALFTTLAAQVAVPVQPVPFTLQTMLVILSGAFLGSVNGAMAQLLYLTVGIMGVPVFAGFSFGFAPVFGPTGGYLISFPISAFIVGYILEKKRNTFTIIVAMLAGTIFTLLMGSTYLAALFGGNFKESFYAGAVIFSGWGLIKVAASASIYSVFSKKYPKLPN